PLGLATSSTPTLVQQVLAEAGIADCFAVTITAEQAGRGKPAPDVYLAVAALGVAASRSVAVEDSTNGIRSAHTASLAVIALPNRQFPPAPEALALAAAEISSLDELTEEVITSALRSSPPTQVRR